MLGESLAAATTNMMAVLAMAIQDTIEINISIIEFLYDKKIVLVNPIGIPGLQTFNRCSRGELMLFIVGRQ